MDLLLPEQLLSVNSAEEYKLKKDEMWPEEIAHLFDNLEEGQKRPGKICQSDSRTRPDTRHKMRLVCVLFHFENNTGHTDGPTDLRTDGRTDGHDLL